ncbi:hypothetical protein M8994_17950 [Brucella sp. 21LCYQ03]|nr:hypothetical protein [Brucella sp. 21LCYQ03]
MKSVLIAAAAFAMISGSAFAQEAPKPPAPPEAAAPGTPPPPPPSPRGGPRPAPDKSAHIRVEDKGYKVDVKCAEDQSTVECAEIVYKLLDRVSPPKK